jgi:hypothetical protein
MADALRRAGWILDPTTREFRAGEVPVQLINDNVVQPIPKSRSEIDGVLTIGLADLINLKLRSGAKNLARSQDIADVVGLIRANKLSDVFTPQLHKSVRAEYRKLVKAVQDEQQLR